MFKQKILPFVGLLLITFSTLIAQEITFQSAVGGFWSDYGYAMDYTDDGGFIIVGKTNSAGAGNDDVYLTKTDSSGTLLWTKILGGSESEIGYSVKQAIDGGYIVTGMTTSFGLGIVNILLIKTNNIGEPIWSKTFSNTSFTYGQSVALTADSGYIISGYSDHFPNSADIDLIRINSNGDTLWTKRFGGIDNDRDFSVSQTSDEGFILCGYTSSFGTSYMEALLIKTDNDGNIVWSKTYGGSDNDYGYSVEQTEDGGYILAGSTWSFSSGSSDIYLIKTDDDGNVQWSNSFGGINYELAYSVKQTNDRGYIVAGYTDSYGSGNEDVYLIKTDSSGSLLWSKTYGGSNSEQGYSVVQTSDSGFVISGEISSAGLGGADLYLIKTDIDGNSYCNETNPSTITTITTTQVNSVSFITYSGITVNTINPQINTGGTLTTLCTTVNVEDNTNGSPKEYLLYQNYPNPFNPSTKIKYSVPSVETHRDASLRTTLKIYDVLGNEVATLVDEYKPAGTYEVEFNPASSIKNPASGIYFYQLKAGEYVSIKKMMLIK